MLFRNVVAATRPALRLGLVAPQRAAVLRIAPVCFQRSHYRQFSDEVASVPSRKPTIQDVIDSPREYYEMPPDVLLTLAVAECPGARTERLIREIMIVDNVSWDDAEAKMQEIAAANAEINSLQTNLSKTYFKTMAFVSIAMGLASFPLCFDLYTTLWFNNLAVTTEIPPPDDLETYFEVGMWSWGWMEPPLGQLSFFLLCIQFSREQLDKLQYKTYFQTLKDKRADGLCELYPMYHE